MDRDVTHRVVEALDRGGARITVDGAADALPGVAPKRFVEVLERRDLAVELYAPRGHDPQKPHDRDELYVVATGTGDFLCGAGRTRFGPGDVLYVPAGVEHRFVDFSDDFAVWVVFIGSPRL